MTDTLLYANLPSHLKQSFNPVHLENGTFDQMEEHLEKEFELSGLQTYRKQPIPTMSTTTRTKNIQTQPQNIEQQQINCRYRKKPRHIFIER